MENLIKAAPTSGSESLDIAFAPSFSSDLERDCSFSTCSVAARKRANCVSLIDLIEKYYY